MFPVQAEGEYSWVAYNDCAGTTSGGMSPNYTVTSGSTTGYLKNYDSGTDVALLLQLHSLSSSETLTVRYNQRELFQIPGPMLIHAFNGYVEYGRGD